MQIKPEGKIRGVPCSQVLEIRTNAKVHRGSDLRPFQRCLQTGYWSLMAPRTPTRRARRRKGFVRPSIPRRPCLLLHSIANCELRLAFFASRSHVTRSLGSSIYDVHGFSGFFYPLHPLCPQFFCIFLPLPLLLYGRYMWKAPLTDKRSHPSAAEWTRRKGEQII